MTIYFVKLFSRKSEWRTKLKKVFELFFVGFEVDRVSELCVEVSLQVGHLGLDGLGLLFDGLDLGRQLGLVLLQRLLNVGLAHADENLADLVRDLKQKNIQKNIVHSDLKNLALKPKQYDALQSIRISFAIKAVAKKYKYSLFYSYFRGCYFMDPI